MQTSLFLLSATATVHMELAWQSTPICRKKKRNERKKELALLSVQKYQLNRDEWLFDWLY